MRLRADMSRADLATAVRKTSNGDIKASERGVRGWEKGEYVPAGETVVAIAAALDCDVKELYGVDEEDEEVASMPTHLELLEALRPLAELFNAAQRERVA